MTDTLTTSLGTIKYNDCGDYMELLGVPYAKAERFEYATLVKPWDGVLDATRFGNACPQTRAYYEHLEIPERLFYHNEFRKGVVFEYDEDCLNLNMYIPKGANKCPVLVYIHGGGFNSGANSEPVFNGRCYAKKGILTVVINYRVGVLGYFSHSEIKEKYGREGNFGLDDQVKALEFVQKYIAEFGGDPDDVTVMGQSAGAISIQYLSLDKENERLFKKAIMMSGAGLFPKFSLPKRAEDTREYWLDFISICKVESLEELKTLPVEKLFDAIEEIKKKRKDNTYNTMPVVDGVLIKKPIDELIDTPNNIPYMIGYTNNDMYAILMSMIAHKYAKKVKGYLYYFDIDAPGDGKNGAFHSSDLRYVFDELKNSHRAYDEAHEKVSAIMVQYIANFVKNADPNGVGLPKWENTTGEALQIRLDSIAMGRTKRLKLFWNTLTKGDPT